MSERQLAMPEWLTRKDIAGAAWTVEEGSPARGDAWTILTETRMRVPGGADPTSRVIRAHEMTHAKVSPPLLFQDGRYGVTNESLTVAEEYRVNMLVKAAGFDIDELSDGSEHRSGEIYGQNSDWNSALRFLCAIAETKAATAFIRGVKKHNEPMADSLNEAHKTLKKEMRRILKAGTEAVANTRPTSKWGNEPDHPAGFRYTIQIAELVDSLLVSEQDDNELGESIPDAEEIKNSRTEGRGTFARLIEQRLPKPVKVSGRLGRKRTATDVGRNPRRINRMLTDPERRVFDRRAKGKGGIVLIDQSGSMHLSTEDLWKIIEHAPGCTIIGYSHRPGSKTTPNVWVLAESGSVVQEVPGGNSGNGVDGPALRFALRKRKNGDPFIWVCDGVVTGGSDDSTYQNLTDECAEIVAKNRIHMTATVDEAVAALKKVAQGGRLETRAVGMIQHSKNWRRREAD